MIIRCHRCGAASTDAKPAALVDDDTDETLLETPPLCAGCSDVATDAIRDAYIVYLASPESTTRLSTMIETVKRKLEIA